MTNEVIKAMIERRSCRKFKAEQIKDEELQAILEAGKYAATGKGLQSPKMVVIQNPEVIAKLSKWNADIMGVTSDPFYGPDGREGRRPVQHSGYAPEPLHGNSRRRFRAPQPFGAEDRLRQASPLF